MLPSFDKLYGDADFILQDLALFGAYTDTPLHARTHTYTDKNASLLTCLSLYLIGQNIGLI